MAKSKHTKKGMSGSEWVKARNKRLTNHLKLATKLKAERIKKSMKMEELAKEGKLTLEMPKPKPKTFIQKAKDLFKGKKVDR